MCHSVIQSGLKGRTTGDARFSSFTSIYFALQINSLQYRLLCFRNLDLFYVLIQGIHLYPFPVNSKTINYQTQQKFLFIFSKLHYCCNSAFAVMYAGLQLMIIVILVDLHSILWINC